jgi:hypothetical protein
MAETAGPPPLVDEGAPSLDPQTIEHAYRRERRRRNSKLARRDDVRSSNARFYVVLSLLLLLTVVIALSALRQIQHTFGI